LGKANKGLSSSQAQGGSVPVISYL
jgi:hypothetical protein